MATARGVVLTGSHRTKAPELAAQTAHRAECRREGVSCTRVTTERTRTWVEDGRTEIDYVTARYRPEGRNCDGSDSDPDPTTTTTSVFLKSLLIFSSSNSLS